MAEERLKHPPMIEALVEIKWELTERSSAGYYDPHYQLLLGSFYDKIKSRYPYHEPLPTSEVPDDVTGRMVKHRFRTAKNEWPLVQIGPGVITVNETGKYDTFEVFKPRVIEVIGALFDCHPNTDDLKISSLQIRYIDAVEFDYYESNICDFLTDKMHIESKIPECLTISGNTEELPISFALGTVLRCKEPPGNATLKINTGHRLKQRAVIWNQIFESSGEDVPKMPDEFEDWIDKAHKIIHAWFDGIIEGDLKEGFNSD